MDTCLNSHRVPVSVWIVGKFCVPLPLLKECFPFSRHCDCVRTGLICIWKIYDFTGTLGTFWQLVFWGGDVIFLFCSICDLCLSLENCNFTIANISRLMVNSWLEPGNILFCILRWNICCARPRLINVLLHARGIVADGMNPVHAKDEACALSRIDPRCMLSVLLMLQWPPWTPQWPAMSVLDACTVLRTTS